MPQCEVRSASLRYIARQPLLSDAIVHHARYSGSSVALVCGEDRITWRELEQRSTRVALALADLGLMKGDKVCTYLNSSARAFEILWGIVRGGYVLVSLNLQVSGAPLVKMINKSDARLIISESAFVARVAENSDSLTSLDLGIVVTGDEGAYRSFDTHVAGASNHSFAVTIEPTDSLSILYTSGTTGAPKGIEHSHEARLNFVHGLGPVIGICDRTAVTLVATPLYTNGTWITMAPTLFRGGRLVLMPKFSAEQFLKLVETEGCTHCFLVPTQIKLILEALASTTSNLNSLRALMSAGQALPPNTYSDLRAALPHVAVYEAYGMSEGFGTCAGPADFANGKQGSVGKSWYLDDIAIVGSQGEELPPGEVGEIAGWGGGMMKGYYQDAQHTADSVWRGLNGRVLLKSGDLGYLDRDGYLFVSGRIKDMIKSGGLNVFASDIEFTFSAHPLVLEVAAIGIPHPKWVETPVLFVILKSGTQISAEELREWGNSRLAKYQRVHSLRFCDDLPRVTYGKVNKQVLRAQYAQVLAKDVS